jgi:DNA-directed RNA polymerase specialized sigma24 family protein
MAGENAGRGGGFPTTHWSLIALAREGDTQRRNEALDELLGRYRPALLAHLTVTKRIEPNWAEDVVQDFICDKILERDLFSRAAPELGRFRSLLLKSLSNYLIDEIRAAKARGKWVSLEMSPEDFEELVAVENVAADAFNVQWSRQVIGDALTRMREDCLRSGRTDIWGVFELRLLAPILRGVLEASYEEVVARFGFKSAEKASNVLMTAKRRFKRTLQTVIAEYAGSEDEIEEELLDLRKALASCGPLESETYGQALIPTTSYAGTDFAELDQTTPRILAKMLEVSERREDLWDDEDLAALLRDELAQPLDTLLSQHEAAQAVPSPPSSDVPPPTTLGELLQHPQPPLQTLRAVKRLARRRINTDTSFLPPDINSAIYFATIAAALVHHGERITKSDDEVLRRGFAVMLDRPWLDGTSRQLLRKGVATLGSA